MVICAFLCCFSVIFGWGMWQFIRILDDRASYRRDRASLEAALHDAIERADKAERALRLYQEREKNDAPYYDRLRKQVKTYQRMIYGELDKK